MKLKTRLAAAAAALTSTLAILITTGQAADPTPAAPAKPDAAGVVSIELPVMEPKLPDAKGRETVLAACVMCHSTRYIAMQPRVSRAAWTANVDKMRKIFGAPMSDAQAAEVVDYLVAIRGAEAAAKP